MLSQLGIRTKLLLIVFVVNLVATTTSTVHFYYAQKADLLKGIDSVLMTTAYGVMRIVDQSYHDRIAGAASIAPEEYRRVMDQLSEFAQQTEARWVYTFMQSGNTYVEVTATNGDCVGKDSVGLVVRVDATITPSGYAYEISCDGSWRFRRFHGSETPAEVVGWAPSNSIQTGLGAVNRLGLWAYQGEFELFANGYPIGEAADPNLAYTIGFIALYVRASQTFDLTATFDDLAFWHIPFQP